MKKILFIFLILSIGLMGCEELNTIKRKINRAHNVSVYAVAISPTAPEAQDSLKQYILDFEITDTLPVNDTDLAALKKAFVNEDNYDSLHIKRCPFIGSYAVTFDDKVTAILSKSSCAKIKAKITKKDTLYAFDLSSDNDIYKVLDSLQPK
ncbi:hypothetical protein [Neptunitalea lumnitzerae]|nr:hypothetical protein [Neptunitalea sp. Y10]